MFILLKDLLKTMEGNFLYLVSQGGRVEMYAKEVALEKYGDKKVVNIGTHINNIGARLVVEIEEPKNMEHEKLIYKRIKSQIELLEGWRSVTSDVMFNLLVNNYIEGVTDALYILGIEYSTLLKNIEQLKKGDIIDQ